MSLTKTHTVTGYSSGDVDITFTFDYLDDADIKVYKTDTSGTALILGTDWQFKNKKEVTLLAASSNFTIANNDVFLVQRETDVDDAFVTYAPGSSVRAEDLNNNQLQALFAAQEREERSVADTGGTVTGDIIVQAASIVFEGTTVDDFETTVTAADPTADRTITLPNVTGTLVTTGDTNTVTGTMIAGDAINGDRIADDSVDSEHYVAGSIDLEHMSANSVDSDQYVDGSIDRVHLAADVIDGSKIADNAIDSEHYTDGSIDRVHLSNDIIDGSKLADDAVDSEHITDGAIDLVHMSANSVDSDQYVDGSIDRVHLSADVIDGTKIEDDAVDSEHIAAGAIDLEHMSADSVDSDQYVDGSIDEEHIAANAVTSTKIKGGTILNSNISSSAAIAGSKISMSLNQLSDVNVGTPGSAQDDQVLAWDNANSEFSLTAASGGGGLGDIVDDSSPQLGGNLDVQARQIFTSTTNGDIELAPNGTGVVEIRGNDNAGSITLNCENNSHGVTIRGPAHSAAATYTLTLPVNDGDANQFLQTDGGGVTSWQTVDTTGASSNVVALNNATTTDGFTIAANRNVAMLGPLTVNSGETITVGSGSKFVILN